MKYENWTLLEIFLTEEVLAINNQTSQIFIWFFFNEVLSVQKAHKD